ncbi:MAG: tetratricopeptide repeat protein [Gammaproteobacteria bacterium]
MVRRLFRLVALACVLAPATAFSQTGNVLTEAERLIRAGRGADAWRLLSAQEAVLAGEPLYDYLYGVAALDAGQPRQAITALERVLANDPSSTPARLELGRAYYALGDRVSAERQFRAVLAQNPSPATRATADAWLRSMQPQAAGSPSGWRSGYEFGAGYDSNANASTDDTTFFGVLLDPTNVEQSSSFLTLAGWFGYTGSAGSGRVETTGRIGHRFNPDADFVDQTIASLGTALRFGDGPTVFGIGLGGWYGLLDGDPHQWNASLELSVSHAFGDGWRTTGLLRAGQQRYEDSDFPNLSVLDMDQLTAALSLQRAGETGYFGITLYGGTEDEQESGSPFGNDRLGVQLYGSAYTTAGHGIGLQLAWMEIDYQDTPGFFGVLERSDDAFSAAITGDLRDWPAAGYHLLPRIGWSRNQSSISLYEYDRFEAGLTLTRSFR